eukprot:1592455-Prymnesium_polylepis.1
MLASLLLPAAWHGNAPVIQRSGSLSVAMSAEAAAKQAWLARNKPAWGPPSAFASSVAPTAQNEPPSPEFVHAPLSYFALEHLAPKGTRREQGSLVDVGEPCDFSRPLVPQAMWSGASVG